MKYSQFIFALMLGSSFATMARADDTSYANCVAAVGADNCVRIKGSYDTYYALSGDAGNQTMTIYGTKESGSTAAIVRDYAFYNLSTDKSRLPEGVTSLKTSGNVDIGDGAFAGVDTALTSIDLTGVQTIGGWAFSGATDLTSVNLTGVQTIGNGAFMDATGLTSVDLTSVETIGLQAFWGATGLTSVDLTRVETIGMQAFWGATGLTSVVISDSLLDSNGNILGYSCDVNNVCAGIYSDAFEGSGLNTIYCPKGKTCSNSFERLSGTPTIISYSKNDDGTYSVDENMYANADMMTKGITCEGAQCTALRTALDAGGTCSTQDACNTLAAGYATPQPSQPTKPQRADIRIYTIDEANAVAGKKNRVSIKYR